MIQTFMIEIWFVSYLWKHPFIHRCPHTERPVRYNPHDKQHDERFPECEPKDTGNHIRHHDGCSDIHHRNIEDPVCMRTFSRAPKYVFVLAQIKADVADFHTCIIYHREITNHTATWVQVF
jgi:hypothetical protein